MPLVPEVPFVGQESLVYEIAQATKSTLETDPSTKVDGSLGVASIVIASVVPDGTEITLTGKLAGQCPQLAVWALATGQGEIVGCNLERNPFAAVIWLVVEHNRKRSGGFMDSDRKYHDLIRNAARVVQATIRNYSTTWLASGTQITSTQAIDFTEFERMQQLRRRDAIRATIPIHAYQGTSPV